MTQGITVALLAVLARLAVSIKMKRYHTNVQQKVGRKLKTLENTAFQFVLRLN
jgi:ABC-type amino acid transport system permease subunit